MPYVDCDNHCQCGEICDGETYYECDECEHLENEIEDLKREVLSESQEKKLEEYERLKTWLLNTFGTLEYKLKPSDFILGLDLVVAKLLVDYQYCSQWVDLVLCEEDRARAYKERGKALLKL